MRFKKLRLSVGITLILFIFIAGSIIIFGKLVDKNYGFQSDNQDQKVILVDPKQIALNGVPTENDIIKLGEEDKNVTFTKPIEQPNVVEPTPTPPEPVVVHPKRRTHAS